MENKIEIEFRNISTAVSCPICLRKFTTRLSVDFLSKQAGAPISVVCVSCALEKINEIKNGRILNGNN
jgi:hypothetical protein